MKDVAALASVSLWTVSNSFSHPERVASNTRERVLTAARDASRWEAGVPSVRGDKRTDLGGEGTRRPCTVTPREPVPAETEPLKQRGAA